MIDPNIIIPAVLTFLIAFGGLLFKYFQYKTENKKLLKEKKESDLKLDIFDKVMDLTSINNIKMAVDRVFETTIADRFLILIAINGKDDFNYVSVIFEQHKSKELAVNATARYKNIEIDKAYKEMLRQAERSTEKVIHLNVENMEDCLLKSFYEMEGVNHAKVRHLLRKPIDRDNDVLIYSSLATHKEHGYTLQELAFMKAQIESTIIPNLEYVLK